MAHKNCNVKVVAINISVASILVVNILVTDYNATTIATSRPFLSYINTGFHFSTCKNHNVTEAILVIGMLVTSGPVTDMPKTNVLVTSISVVGMSAASLSIVRAFVFNIFLAILTFMIIKIAT